MTWRCGNCAQEVDDDFEVCWNCEAVRDGIEPLSEPLKVEEHFESLVNCVRCGAAISFLGSGRFRDASGWAGWSFLVTLLVDKEDFDIFCCVGCGQVELFTPQVAANRRPQ